MARPIELTPKVQARILKAIRSGCPREEAARAAGIRHETLYRWLQRGRDGDKRFAEFSQAVEKADAECMEKYIQVIQKASGRSWQAGAWMLERKWPAKFGQRVRVTVDQELNGFLDKLQGSLPEEIFKRVLDVAADAAGSPTAGAADAGGSEGEIDDGEDPPSAG